MGDVAHRWDPVALAGDWTFDGGQLGTADDLATAVVLSLFTDARARDDDRLPDDSGDRRGWWGDSRAPQGPLGSRLWLLAREKTVDATRRRAEAYAREALQWLIADGLAAEVTVTATIVGTDRIDMTIDITLTDGGRQAFAFGWPWRQA